MYSINGTCTTISRFDLPIVRCTQINNRGDKEYWCKQRWWLTRLQIKKNREGYPCYPPLERATDCDSIFETPGSTGCRIRAWDPAPCLLPGRSGPPTHWASCPSARRCVPRLWTDLRAHAASTPSASAEPTSSARAHSRNAVDSGPGGYPSVRRRIPEKAEVKLERCQCRLAETESARIGHRDAQMLELLRQMSTKWEAWVCQGKKPNQNRFDQRMEAQCSSGKYFRYVWSFKDRVLIF